MLRNIAMTAVLLFSALAHAIPVSDVPDPWPKSDYVATPVNKTRIVMQVAIMLTTVLSGIAIIVKLFTFVRRKTRDGRKIAMAEFNNTTMTLVVLGPAAAAPVGDFRYLVPD